MSKYLYIVLFLGKVIVVFSVLGLINDRIMFANITVSTNIFLKNHQSNNFILNSMHVPNLSLEDLTIWIVLN